ncbi:unnamed protein product [Blepharisma stoltei]|uniref:Uncharacterized protein n=1 Tax=Blepharisma stoltei TaxID=1481888 RepID=A0AAU9IK50_9CILI|nr:unnamed protein product [Blepharisma stoltei]
MSSLARKSEFDQPLFGCSSDPKSCLIVLCVPCGSAIVQGLAVKNARNEGFIVPYCINILLACIGAAINRGQIRNKYDIEGGFITDFCYHLFFMPCSACQEYREVTYRNSLHQP